MKTQKLLISFLLFTAFVAPGLAATFTVNSVTGTGAGTFTWAVNQANATAGPHTINFTGLTGVGPWTYAPGSPIPDLTSTDVLIDGTTAPGYNCANGPMFIVVGPGFNDFQINGARTIIKAISFRAHQVELNAANCEMYGCWFNLNDNGTAGAGADPNGAFLITNGCDNCKVGAAGCGQGNVISGFGSTGSAAGLFNISGGTTMTVAYTYVGTSASGNTLVTNSTGGECLRVDGTTPSLTIDHCVFAGAKGGTPDGYGINFNGGTHNSLIISNCMIGAPASGNVSGNATFGNDKAGIYFLGSVGTGISITNNVICNNGRNTVNGSQVDDSGIAINAGASKIGGTITNNYIGVDASNNLGGNKFYGIYMFANVTGLDIRGNVVGDNGNNGDVAKYGGGIAAAVGAIATVGIYGNYIGVSATGTDIGNYNNGIHIESTTTAPSNITIGTSAAADRNYIGFNKGMRTSESGGIYIYGSTGIVIQNNYIGLSPSGGNAGNKNGSAHARGGNGIMCLGSGALRVRIGGTTANTQNYICYNANNGVNIYNAADYIEMNYNSMYCNTNKAINLNCGASQGNSGFGCATLTATGVGAQPYASVTGNKPANSLVDVFGTNACALGAGSCIPQQQYRYGGVAASAATTYTYNNGTAMYDDLSVDATGTGTDCSSGYCRTSELLCIDNPLPVKWLNFNITSEQHKAILNWSTASETNNEGFIIERSSNGIDFIAIGRQNGAVNSRNISNYTFTDEQTLSGVSYYRLKQVDIDQKFSYSDVRTYSADETTQLYVSPVPNNGEFDINVASTASDLHISITDIFGREVYHQNIANNSNFNTLHVSLNQAPGIYLVYLRTGSEYKMVKICIE